MQLKFNCRSSVEATSNLNNHKGKTLQLLSVTQSDTDTDGGCFTNNTPALPHHH